MTTNVGKKIKKRGLSFRKTNQVPYYVLNFMGTAKTLWAQQTCNERVVRP